ncbi:EVE domain-containing protein [Marinobacter sp. M216]|uniref:EVE domain-containing protein n=1 Tax=Marinobacter albus TaxID=3030833 RepID=A0ABT7H8M6_9GAMM|nr:MULTISPECIES: EVE domain-containing protein [unclassified Marinobacter]MBW7471014.1 EVE domain-containing protein [Marinobacter sp. F4218]MDK9556706.1 EVE domain-containing protein [Marinobacter sp. M216]
MAKWLVKTEPSECSINDFAKAPDKSIPWDGVRNYQARNFLREMAVGDEVFIYHSSCKRIGIAGIVKVVRGAYPDPTQFDPASAYHDSRSTPAQPRWQAVDMKFVHKLPRLVQLDELKGLPGLEGLPLIRRGNRLSVMPVSEDEWQIILRLT